MLYKDKPCKSYLGLAKYKSVQNRINSKPKQTMKWKEWSLIMAQQSQQQFKAQRNSETEKVIFANNQSC